jgi:hypothetical protein
MVATVFEPGCIVTVSSDMSLRYSTDERKGKIIVCLFYIGRRTGNCSCASPSEQYVGRSLGEAIGQSAPIRQSGKEVECVTQSTSESRREEKTILAVWLQMTVGGVPFAESTAPLSPVRAACGRLGQKMSQLRDVRTEREVELTGGWPKA